MTSGIAKWRLAKTAFAPAAQIERHSFGYEHHPITSLLNSLEGKSNPVAIKLEPSALLRVNGGDLYRMAEKKHLCKAK